MKVRDINHLTAIRLALIAGIAGIVVIAFATSFRSMWALWQTSDHHHGILIFPIVGFLVWLRRYEIGDARFRADSIGLLVVIGLAGLWVLARLAGIQFIEHMVVLALIPASAWTLFGRDLAAILSFPFLFILLATPVSDALVPPLMVITADISTGLLKLFGIPFIRDGQYITLAGGFFVIADVCSGVRYLITGIVLSLLYGHLVFSGWAKRVGLVAVTLVTLILTNGLRAFIVMAVASASNSEFLGGRDHIYFGWLLFGVVMMGIMWFGARFADDALTPSGQSHPEGSANAISRTLLPTIFALGVLMLTITIKPLQADFGEFTTLIVAGTGLLVLMYFVSRPQTLAAGSDKRQTTREGAAPLRQTLILALALVAIIGAPRLVASVESASTAGVELKAFLPPSNCAEKQGWVSQWRPQFHKATVEYAASYECASGNINIYSAAYADTRQGAELISSENRVIPPEWDQFVSYRGRPQLADNDVLHGIEEVVTSGTAEDVVVWFWYEIDGRSTSSPARAKMLQIITLLQRRPAGGRVIVLETVVGTDIALGRKRLSYVARELLSQ